MQYLVTGANKGIGKAICEAILNDIPNSFVYLGSRDTSRGEEAVKDIVSKNPSAQGRLQLLPIDVSNGDSVKQASEAVKKEGKQIHALINNAGLAFHSPFQDVLDVNYFGLKAVTEAFLPLIPEGGRIVNVASASGPMYVAKLPKEQQAFWMDPSVTVEQIDAECKKALQQGLDAQAAYGFSKACVNLYTILLANAHPKLIINSITPGFIDTDLTKGYGATTTPAEGTKSTMHCLVADCGTGKYFGSDALRSPLDCYRGPGDPEYKP